MAGSIKKLFPDKLKGAVKDKLLIAGHNLLNIKNITYSQAGEDLNLRNYFMERESGFFVDIGAFHPFVLSNTYYLYKYYGWRGINLDARPGSMELFDKHRSEDINLEYAVSSSVKELDYYFIDDRSSMNSFSKEFLEKENAFHKVKKVIKVNASPLSEILDKHLPEGKSIDFMNIDVEGMEIDVLGSNNWDKYRPEIIMLESSEISLDGLRNSEEAIFMKSKGYEPLAVTILSQTLRNVLYKRL